MEEIDDWVSWYKERIFNAFNKNPNIPVCFPEEMLKQKCVSISVELDSGDEYIDYSRIIEFEKIK